MLKCGLLIHIVSEKCYLLILLFKCKNAKHMLACHMPGVYQICTHTLTHTHPTPMQDIQVQWRILNPRTRVVCVMYK